MSRIKQSIEEKEIDIYRSFIREIENRATKSFKISRCRDEIERESIERRIETNSWHQCTSVCSRRSFMREWNRNRESCGVGRDYSRPTGTSHFRRSARVKLSWRMRGLEDSVAFNRPSRTCLSGVSIVPYLSLPVQRTLEGTFFSILDQILCR